MTSTEIKKLSMDLFLEIREDIVSGEKSPAEDMPTNFEQLQDVCDANMYLESTYEKLYLDGKNADEINTILNKVIDRINYLIKSKL